MRKGIFLVFILAVLITLYEIADFATHGNIVGFLINRGSVSRTKSDFTPRYLGLWTKDGTQIPKCQRIQRVQGENAFEFSGLDPAPIVRQGLGFVYFKGDESTIDELTLTRLEWSEARQSFMAEKSIPFHIAPNYRGKPRMFEIVIDPPLESGYYAFNYEQNPAVIYNFIIIDDVQDAQYGKAAETCEKFWKYLMAEKHARLSGLLSSDLSRRLGTEGEFKRFRSGFLDEILSRIKARCRPKDPFAVYASSHDREDLEYSPALRLDRIRPLDVLRGRIVIPYEVRVSADKLPPRIVEMEFEVMGGKISNYSLPSLGFFTTEGHCAEQPLPHGSHIDLCMALCVSIWPIPLPKSYAPLLLWFACVPVLSQARLLITLYEGLDHFPNTASRSFYRTFLHRDFLLRGNFFLW
ncbi:MAG: hypothetical protein AB1611_01270 [bacterium]